MIIFCFLTYNDIIPIKYWNAFFKNIDQNKYQVWIHPKLKLNKNLYEFPINIVKNKINTINKSHISIVQSTLQLLKESFNNENGKHFIFCTQNCIPLYNFIFYEEFLKNLDKSIVSFIDFNRKDRYNKLHINIKKYISYQQFIKQQPNMILVRDDVNLLIKNDLTQYFKAMECPDEHYFINVLLYILKRNIIKSQTHFCNFDKTKTQAIEFKNINTDLIQFIKNNGYLFMRKVY
jgi:hypothetical protein